MLVGQISRKIHTGHMKSERQYGGVSKPFNYLHDLTQDIVRFGGQPIHSDFCSFQVWLLCKLLNLFFKILQRS